MARKTLVVAMVLFVGSLAGCVAKKETDDPRPAPPEVRFSESKPSMSKVLIDANPTTSQTSATDTLLGMPPMLRRDLDVPGGTGRMQLAIDLRFDPASQGPMELSLKLVQPDGKTRYEMPKRMEPGKTVEWIEGPLEGKHGVVVTFRGSWKVGIVAVFVPTGYTPGTLQTIATPAETEVTHSFQFPELQTIAGQRNRITLFDYDPHEGVQNLQHNLVLPAVGAKTEGRTTWGEVRVLDFTAPAQPGAYDFFCEYHDDILRGTLTVV